MKCRFCNSNSLKLFLDLGFSPPANAYVKESGLSEMEEHFPLRVLVCEDCYLVQTEDYTRKESMFNSDYAYFSSVSSSWLAHAAIYCENIVERLSLKNTSFVVEVASNDGYMLKNFQMKNIPCLGVEPTDGTAEVCEKKGISVIRDFFGKSVSNKIVSDYRKADLIICNNVYAHVPDINDFTIGLKNLLNESGTVTIEFPHFQELILNVQYDTIYHEHYSYFSLYTVQKIFEQHGLKIYDVEIIITHGGSLRVYGTHLENKNINCSESAANIIAIEKFNGLQEIEKYEGFRGKVESIKLEVLDFLVTNKKLGKKIVAYGAAAKGMTLLNYVGIGPELIECIYDQAPLKMGCFTPGKHIPIVSPNNLKFDDPDIVIVFPWNILGEIDLLIAGLIKKEVTRVTITDVINKKIIYPATPS
jgi:hypothetical protein